MAEVTNVDRDIPRVDFRELRVGTREYYGSLYSKREDIPDERSSLYIVLPRMTGDGSLERFLETISDFIPEAEQELRGHQTEEGIADEHLVDEILDREILTEGSRTGPAPRRTITDIKLGWESK